MGDQTYLWYSHWDCDGEFRNQDIGLATLRRDGFGYLSAMNAAAPAVCETAFFDADEGARLFVNAEGTMRIEILDQKLKVIGGVGATKSGTHVEALALPKGRIAVRAVLGTAKLFALYLEN